MQNLDKESISSLLDNELSAKEAAELMATLENDDALNKQLDRYALIRDALNDDVVVHQESFVKSIQLALAGEPTVLAPKPIKRENKTYVAVALAASFIVFSVVLFDVDLIDRGSYGPQSIASVESGQEEQRLALEEQQDKMLEDGSLPTVQFVTYEK